MAIWYILWSFGIYFSILVCRTKKIWQPWFQCHRKWLRGSLRSEFIIIQLHGDWSTADRDCTSENYKSWTVSNDIKIVLRTRNDLAFTVSDVQYGNSLLKKSALKYLLLMEQQFKHSKLTFLPIDLF
jgi:hypothetical protein